MANWSWPIRVLSRLGLNPLAWQARFVALIRPCAERLLPPDLHAFIEGQFHRLSYAGKAVLLHCEPLAKRDVGIKFHFLRFANRTDPVNRRLNDRQVQAAQRIPQLIEDERGRLPRRQRC